MARRNTRERAKNSGAAAPVSLGGVTIQAIAGRLPTPEVTGSNISNKSTLTAPYTGEGMTGWPFQNSQALIGFRGVAKTIDGVRTSTGARA